MHYRLTYLTILILIIYIVLSFGNKIEIQNNIQEAIVEKVIDGDTIVIDGGIQVRYIGVDTPEIGEYYSQEATDKNKQLVEGKKIKIERDVLYKDKYQRILGYIIVDNIMVNEELLKNGFADILFIQPDVKYKNRLINAYNYAKDNKLGLWNKNQ